MNIYCSSRDVISIHCILLDDKLLLLMYTVYEKFNFKQYVFYNLLFYNTFLQSKSYF